MAVIAAADDGVLSPGIVVVVDAFAWDVEDVEFREIELEVELDENGVEEAVAAEVMMELFDGDDSVAL